MIGCTMEGNGPLNDDLDSDEAQACGVTTDSVIDLTINLNSFSDTWQWAWMNGELLYWSVTSNAQGQLLVHVRLKPVLTPDVVIPEGPNCCTCTMPENCDAQESTQHRLKGGFFFDCDQQAGEGDYPLQGAVFATSHAIMGGMQVAFSSGGPVLEYKLSGAHLAPDGSLTRGSLAAFLPLTVLTQLWPDITTVQTALTEVNISRTSDLPAQSEETIVVEAREVQSFGSLGIGLKVDHISFSAPTYTAGPNAGSSVHACLSLLLFAQAALASYSLRW